MIRFELINVCDENQDIENLGLCSIASYLRKKEVPVSLLFLDTSNVNENSISEFKLNGDFVGFSLSYLNAKEVYKAANIIKTKMPNIKIFVGGRLATDGADHVLNDCSDIDFVVQGDGEYPLEAIVNEGKEISDISGIKTRNNDNKIVSQVNINEIPWPARDYLTMISNYHLKPAWICSSCGCCGSCSFCSVNSYKVAGGGKWQGRSIEDADLRTVKRIY